MGNLLSSERQLREFNRLSNGGIVFGLDLSERADLGERTTEDNSTLVLTQDEVNERTAWEAAKRQIQKLTEGAVLLKNRGRRTEDLLRLQIAAPVLHKDPARVSARSAIGETGTKRWYPPQLSAWTTFEQLVENFCYSGRQIDSPR